MFSPHTFRFPRILALGIITAFLLTSLGCGFLSGLPAPTATATEPPMLTSVAGNPIVFYTNGVANTTLENGATAVVDSVGYYGLTFPSRWKVGGIVEEFRPVVEEYANTCPILLSFFDKLMSASEQNSFSARLFAFDTSPEHFNEQTLTTIHVGMYQNEYYLQATMDTLVNEYANYLVSSSNGLIEVSSDIAVGKSDYGVPYAILTYISDSETLPPVYGGTAIVQTDTVYLEMLYTTTDVTIDIIDELFPILNTLMEMEN